MSGQTVPVLASPVAPPLARLPLPGAAVLRRLCWRVQVPNQPMPPEDLFLLLSLGDWLLAESAYDVQVPQAVCREDGFPSVQERRAIWHLLVTRLDWEALIRGREAGLTVAEIAACLRAGLTWPEIEESVHLPERHLVWSGLGALRAGTARSVQSCCDATVSRYFLNEVL